MYHFIFGYGKDRRASNLWARKRRWLEYVKDKRNDVKVQYLATDLSLEQAKELEIKYQIRYRELGYPIVGLIGNQTDEEFSKRQSAKLRGIKRTDEQKEHYRQAMRKRIQNGETFERLDFTGKHHTEETKRKISESNRGKPGNKGKHNGMYNRPSPNRKSVEVYKNRNIY